MALKLDRSLFFKFRNEMLKCILIKYHALCNFMGGLVHLEWMEDHIVYTSL